MTAKFQHRNLPHLLLIARETLLDRFRPVLREHGLTEQQWRIIRVLSDAGPLPLKDIVEHCQIFGSSLTGIVTRMESQHYVRRVAHAEDGRVTLITLTPKARKLVDTMRPLIDAIYDDLEAQVGKPRLTALVAMLDETLSALARKTVDGPVASAQADHAA